jgi:hypothetical protein
MRAARAGVVTPEHLRAADVGGYWLDQNDRGEGGGHRAREEPSWIELHIGA